MVPLISGPIAKIVALKSFRIVLLEYKSKVIPSVFPQNKFSASYTEKEVGDIIVAIPEWFDPKLN